MRRIVFRKRFQVLVADPPWKFKDTVQGGRGAQFKYRVMATHDIARIALPDMADQSVLFMWRVAAMQEEALFVMKAWGFKLHSEITWIKRTVNDKLHFGMGHVTRAAHEVCLVGMRGRTLHPAVRNVRSVFDGLVREHSEKPEEFYELVDTLYPAHSKYEMFARRTRPGWTQFGDQLGVLDGT